MVRFILCADTGMQLKRDSPATGSWSIQDEIRRVRSRATEEMLRTLPSSKIDWSAFAIEYKNNVNSSAIENIEASLGEKVHDFTNQVDTSSNLARGFATQASPGTSLLTWEVCWFIAVISHLKGCLDKINFVWKKSCFGFNLTCLVNQIKL